MWFKMYFTNQVSVTLTCNPTHSGGRDKEDHSLKPAQANSSWDSISKKHITVRTGGVAQGIGPAFKPQYHKKMYFINYAVSPFIK
jgi:hypothetical protein